MKLHRKIIHNEKVCRGHELGSYAQGQGSLAVFKVTARDQGHYKGHWGGHLLHTVTFSCFFYVKPSEECSSSPYMHCCILKVLPSFICGASLKTIPVGYLETDLNATGEYFSMFTHP